MQPGRSGVGRRKGRYAQQKRAAAARVRAAAKKTPSIRDLTRGPLETAPPPGPPPRKKPTPPPGPPPRSVVVKDRPPRDPVPVTHTPRATHPRVSARKRREEQAAERWYRRTHELAGAPYTPPPAAQLVREGLMSPTSLTAPFALAARFAADATAAGIGFPGGIKDLVTHPVRTAEHIGKGYAYTYGPAVHGDFGTTGHRISEHPLGPFLDAATVASLGFGAGVRAGVLPAVARERSLALEAGHVQPYASPNPLTRAIQHKIDRYSEQHPDLRILGAKSRVARRIPFESERELARAQTEAVPFNVARKKLSVPEGFAYDVIARYGDKAAERLRQEINYRQHRLRQSTRMAERAHQRKRIVQLRLAERHVLDPKPRLQRTLVAGRDLQYSAQVTKIEMGQLTPETAALRIDQPSRIVTGAEDATAGEGAFFYGDVAQQPIKSLGQRARGATGKQRKLVHQSEGILYSEGRVRSGTAPTYEDFARTVRYKQHQTDIKDILTFSRELNHDKVGGLDHPTKDVYVNPEGYKIPRSFREEPAEAGLEGLTPQEIQAIGYEDYKALVENTFPTEAQVRNLPEAMQAKVRQVDARIADAYRAGQTHLSGHGNYMVRAVGTAAKSLNNLLRTGLLYAKGSFVPANFLGNTVFGAIQQGPWFFYNLARAVNLIRKQSVENLHRIDAEMGQGAAMSISGPGEGLLGATTKKLARFSGKLADTGPRRAAWFHEAAKSGYKTNEQISDLLTKEHLRPRLNQVSEQAQQAMVKFGDLSPSERRFVSQFIFVYPWVKGATRYGLRLPIDHPGKADIVAHMGEEGKDETLKELGRLAATLDQLIAVGGKKNKLGTTVAPVVSVASASPLGTMSDVLQSVSQLNPKNPVRADTRLINFLNPAITAGFEAISGIDTFTGRTFEGDPSLEEILYKQTFGSVPAVRLAHDIRSKKQTEPFTGPPAKQKTFVAGGPKEAAGRFALGGLWPRELNLTAAQARAEEDRVKRLPAAEKIRYRAKRELRDVKDHIRADGAWLVRNGVGRDEVQQYLRPATQEATWYSSVKEAWEQARVKKGKNAKLTERERLEIMGPYALRQGRKFGFASDVRNLLGEGKKGEYEAKRAREQLRDGLMPSYHALAEAVPPALEQEYLQRVGDTG